MELRVLQMNQVVQVVFCFSDGLQSMAANPSCLSNRQNSQNLLPPPVGEGRGEGILPNRGNLSQHPNRPNTSLAACYPLSSSLPRGRGRGSCWDEGFCKENRLCRLLFVFQTTCINGCKSKLLFKSPVTAKSTAICSLPRGGGLGRGYSPKSRQSFPTP